MKNLKRNLGILLLLASVLVACDTDQIEEIIKNNQTEASLTDPNDTQSPGDNGSTSGSSEEDEEGES